MLQAKTEDGVLVLLSQFSRKEIQKLRKHHRFFCPVCEEPVIVKAGTQVIPHFAHQAKANCPSSYGEGPYHEKGKLLLYQWLKSQRLDVYIEPYLSEIQQIPDIFLIYKNRRIAIEYQCARVDVETIMQRHIGYQKQGIIPIWILGANQFKRLGRYHLRINHFSQQLIQQFSTDFPLTLYYFCPDTLQIATFQHLYFTRQRSAIGSFQFRKLNKIRFHDLFYKTDLPNETLYELWKKEKQKFRLTSRHFLNKKERQWYQWLYLNNMTIEHLPALVYLPIATQFLMKTPLWDWQSRLVIDMIEPVNVGDKIYKQACEHRFRMQQHHPHHFPLIASQDDPIEAYLNLLEQLQMIKRISQDEYIKIKPIKFPKHIDEANIQDRLLMDQLKKAKNKHNLPIFRYTK